MRKLTRLEKYHMNKASQRGTEKVVAVTPEAMEIESRAIELFARQSSHGFDVWGNQCKGPAVQLQPGYALDIAGMTRAFANAPLSPTDNQGRERAA